MHEDDGYLSTFRQSREPAASRAVYAADLAPEVRASLERRAEAAVAAFRLRRRILLVVPSAVAVVIGLTLCGLLRTPIGLVVITAGIPWTVALATLAEWMMPVRCPWCSATSLERVQPFCPSCGHHTPFDEEPPTRCTSCNARYVHRTRNGRRTIRIDRTHKVRYCWCCGLHLDATGF